MKTKLATSLRVGQIRYLNTLPFYHGLSASLEGSGIEWTWEAGTPSEISRALREGTIDMAPISSIEYLQHQDRYVLFPGLCIGSRDFSASVLLLSPERIEGLDGATISLTEESLSAAALAKILLKFKYRFQNQFRVAPSNPAEMLASSNACLIIGDQALFFRSKEFVYKTDLSEVWWDWAELPFCFSVWAVRKKVYEEHPEEVNGFYRKLKANLMRNLQDIEKLLRDGLGVTIVDEKFPTAFGYLFNLNYALDEEMQLGLARFYELTYEMGLAPRRAEKLEFIDGPV